MTPNPVCVDFESFGIEGRPDYPPVPVGVSIKWPGKPAQYYAWDHLTGNNCTKEEAVAALFHAWCCPDGVLMHNAKFDLDLAETHMGMPPLPWNKIHDTMLLLFLDNPNEKNLGLKPSAERILALPPEEQDAVADWLIANQPIEGVRITKSKSSEHSYGRYIAYAPGDLVGTYANGDVFRTAALFYKLWESVIVSRNMGVAYDRERRLLPILLGMERQGVRVDLEKLKRDIPKYTDFYERCSEWLRSEIGEINLDSDAELTAALVAKGLADEEKLGKTATGKLKADKVALAAAIRDPTLTAMLRYRTALGICLSTFMRPWLATAERSGGFIYTQWQQTKGEKTGARTGRLSSSPNLQNIPRQHPPIFDSEPPIPLPLLPLVRSYVIPYAEGDVLVGRDYHGQEIRVLAHFEEDRLLELFKEDPWTDVHQFAADLIKEMLGMDLDRSKVKILGFSIIYGAGIRTIADRLGVTTDEARRFKDAYMQVFPAIRDMYSDMKLRATTEQPIRTQGGREYYCEPPVNWEDKILQFDYKMLNTLVQGSAADCTKQAIINFDAAKRPGWRLILNVHDELVVSVPASDLDAAHEVLSAAMSDVDFDVPMLSEGKSSADNWGSMVAYDKKGVRV